MKQTIPSLISDWNNVSYFFFNPFSAEEEAKKKKKKKMGDRGARLRRRPGFTFHLVAAVGSNRQNLHCQDPPHLSWIEIIVNRSLNC